MLTQARLKELLEYDPQTGIFTRKVRTTNTLQVGDKAGSPGGNGYILISVDGVKYIASRLAFLWMTGAFPKEKAEHKDGNPLNNKWVNLRNATQQQNMQNRAISSNNKSRLKGVISHRPGRWHAQIKMNGKSTYLGSFNCPAAAHFAYVVAAETYFGEFARAA